MIQPSLTSAVTLGVVPFDLQFLSWTTVLLMFAGLSLPVVLLGMRALTGQSPARRWVAIGLRMAVLLVAVLILGGLRWRRASETLEVVILRDVSPSVGNAAATQGGAVQPAIDAYIKSAGYFKKPVDDKFGSISFDQAALIDALPSVQPVLSSGAIRENGNGTDIANGIRLGLATFSKDSRRRMVLISDGNATQGDTDAAVAAAKSAGVPIDVMPLRYDIKHEVLMDRIVAPSWKREREPFSIDIYVKNTNEFQVTGKLTVTDVGVPMDLDPKTPGVQPTLAVTLPAATADKPSRTLVRIPVYQPTAGTHMFHASFDPDNGVAGAGVDGGDKVDTLTTNNSGDAFTYVQGRGKILYVDNVANGAGEILMRSLAESKIEIAPEDHITPEHFPPNVMQLQNYDAVILANVPYGTGGLSDVAQRNLATYVHDMGGGLVMIGGPNTFGAGSWQGKKLEEVLPVDMDIPATRQIPKGALVLCMDPAEAPNGTYLGIQCALKAFETLSSQDDIGIISYGNGCQWDLPLGPKGDGSKAVAASNHMGLGDLPSFEDAINLALDGDGRSKGLIADDAAQKHIIVITDDDPEMPHPATIQRLKDKHISVSTITVFPHQPHSVANGTIELARATGGRFFGPIEDHPDQLPQIFIKEATVVRRSLINENERGIPLNRLPSSNDAVKGLPSDSLPSVRGLVLTTKKPSPQVDMPIVAVSGTHRDPLLATWQTGLGRAAVYTSDAHNQWGSSWLASSVYNAFWAQLVRSMSRPPMSTEFETNVTQNGGHGHIRVEGTDADNGFANFLNVAGQVLGPDQQPIDAHLVQTGPGRYEGDFETNAAGTYVAVMHAADQNGKQMQLPVAGVAVNESPEMRDLHSNEQFLYEIADRTGGRRLEPFDVAKSDFYNRKGLPEAVSTLPIWDRLIPVLLALILLDVAARRIAWDWAAIQRYMATSAGAIRTFTATHKVETRSSLDALARVKQEAETAVKPVVQPPIRPDPKAKFVGSGKVQGDIASVVGGATDKPIPSAPKTVEPKGITPAGGSMSSLMEAKRRAQQRIKDKEEGA